MILHLTQVLPLSPVIVYVTSLNGTEVSELINSVVVAC